MKWHIAIMLSLSAAACWLMSLQVALVLWIAVFIHELGHYLFIRACGFRAVLFATPFFGFVYPRFDDMPLNVNLPLSRRVEADPRHVLSPLGYGYFLLAGCSLSLAAAGLLTCILAARPYACGILVYADLLLDALLILNVLNLLALFPMTDGGRLFSLLFGGVHNLQFVLVMAVGMITGIVCLWPHDPWVTGILIAISLPCGLSLVSLRRDRTTTPDVTTFLILLSAWVFIAAASLVRLMQSSIWSIITGTE